MHWSCTLIIYTMPSIHCMVTVLDWAPLGRIHPPLHHWSLISADRCSIFEICTCTHKPTNTITVLGGGKMMWSKRCLCVRLRVWGGLNRLRHHGDEIKMSHRRGGERSGRRKVLHMVSTCTTWIQGRCIDGRGKRGRWCWIGKRRREERMWRKDGLTQLGALHHHK